MPEKVKNILTKQLIAIKGPSTVSQRHCQYSRMARKYTLKGCRYLPWKIKENLSATEQDIIKYGHAFYCRLC